MATNFISKRFEKALLQEADNYYTDFTEKELTYTKRNLQIVVVLLNRGQAYSLGCRSSFKLGRLLQSMLERQAQFNCYNVTVKHIKRVIKKIENSF